MTLKLLQLLYVVGNIFVYVVLISCSRNSPSNFNAKVCIQSDEAESSKPSIARKSALKSCAKSFSSVNNPNSFRTNTETNNVNSKYLNYQTDTANFVIKRATRSMSLP